jgi:inhibitor of cysteine peptidase
MFQMKNGGVMLRFLAYILPVFVLLLSACSAVSSSINVSGKDSGKTVKMKKGDILQISGLEGNPTTGYTWEPESKDLKMLKYGGEPVYKATSEAVGAAGTFTLSFTAVSSGQETLKLVYHRPWESGVKPLATYEVTVIVE